MAKPDKRLDAYLGEIKNQTRSAPHSFRPLKLWDLRPNGRCRHCLLPCNAHPIHYWAPARPVGDKSKAALTYENLHGKAGEPDEEY